jgi:hypothetical protein
VGGVDCHGGLSVFARNRKRNKTGEGGEAAWLLRAGRAGAHRAEWLHAAIRELREDRSADQVGAWLKEPGGGDFCEAAALVLRGEVWEEGIGTGPTEWRRLSAEVLPVGLLKRGMAREYKAGDPAPAFGPFVGLARLLLLPVLSGSLLRGLVMLGTQHPHRKLPRGEAERVAGELGLLLELEQARRFAASRKADLELWRRVQGLLAEGQIPT